MKKILIMSVVSLVAVGANAQGIIKFVNRTGSTWQTHVYAPNTENPGLVLQGQGTTTGTSSSTTAEFPTGTVVYTGVGIGGFSSGSGTYLDGTRYTAQLWAVGNTTSAAASSLFAYTQYTVNFRTSGGAAVAGLMPNWPSSGAANDNGITNSIGNGTATGQMRVWDNGGGTATDWGTAVSQNMTRGASATFPITAIFDGGTGIAPTPPNLTNMQSFNLQTAVPEPSTIALGVMGAAAFLLRRRNK